MLNILLNKKIYIKMSDNESNNKYIENTFNQYKIKLSYHLDIINIQIKDNDSLYESNFNLENLRQYRLLIGNFTINEMIEFINGLINQKNIKIEKNENNLKLILISTLPNYPNVELIIKNKNIISNELIEKLINEIKEIKDENNKLKNRIELIENKNDKLNKRIELIENNNNELKNKIKILEGYHKDKKKVKLTKCNLQNINSIQPHNNWINSLSSFPSGNIISVSKDQSIIIYDIHLNILQNIQNAHDDSIAYVEIKDENNFITCSADKSIK